MTQAGEGDMTVLMDFQDRAVRLTSERQEHIAQLDDPDQWKREIEETLRQPDSMSEDFHHPRLRMYYRIYLREVDAERQFYVLVRVRGYDMLVVSAFFGRGFNWGNSIWIN